MKKGGLHSFQAERVDDKSQTGSRAKSQRVEVSRGKKINFCASRIHDPLRLGLAATGCVA